MPPLLAAEPDAAPACSWAAVPGVSTRHALPAGLDTRTCGTFIAVATSRLEAWYTGSGGHPNDCGASHADTAVPADLCVYYFEVEVLAPGVRGTIGVGFSADAFNMSRQPGWEKNSYGYHGDDGKKYHDSGRGDTYGPTFTTGDVVGAGIVLSRGEVFFTKNGVHLGVAFRGARLPLFPTVAMHSPSERILVNFGTEADTPFVFDVGAVVAAERVAQDTSVSATSLPPAADLTLVRDFLHREGYTHTLAALDGATSAAGGSAAAAKAASARWDDPHSLARRAAVRQALLRGDVAAAEAGLAAAHAACPLSPAALERATAALTVARVLECLRRGDALAALQLSRAALEEKEVTATMEAEGEMMAKAGQLRSGAGGAHTPADLRAALVTLAALLPYDLGDVASLPPAVRQLLGLAQREALADTVNDAILSATSPGVGGNSLASPPMLVAAMQHLAACQHALRDAQGGQGEVFDISRAMGVKMGQQQQQPQAMDT